jgi:SAM-dependent MidA family methyltransferase
MLEVFSEKIYKVLTCSVPSLSAFKFFGLTKLQSLKYGLEFSGYTDQYHFLLALGLTKHLRKMEQDGQLQRARVLEVYTLLVDMGTKFKVLIQQKGLLSHKLMGRMLSCSGI